MSNICGSKTFTLIPIGGLGNRLRAICSCIVFCTEHNMSLDIIWFRDHGLNCPFDHLFELSPILHNVTIRNPKLIDYVVNDNPRRRNLWLPKIFQKFRYDRRIYMPELLSYNSNKDLVKQNFSKFKNIFMVSCGIYWEKPDMWKYIVVNPMILKKVDSILEEIGDNIIGVHVRRTDSVESITYSPSKLFKEYIDKELKQDSNVKFYLASDSLEEKTYFKNIYGDNLVTSLVNVDRNSKEGICNAFVELLVLSKSKKMYAGHSSFADLASCIGNVERVLVSAHVNNK